MLALAIIAIVCLLLLALGIASIRFGILIHRAVMTKGKCFAGYQLVEGLAFLVGGVLILLALGLANESLLHN